MRVRISQGKFQVTGKKNKHRNQNIYVRLKILKKLKFIQSQNKMYLDKYAVNYACTDFHGIK